jgi:hypoxanthine phosphoribosyltransferase
LKLGRELIGADAVQRRVREMAGDISRDYQAIERPLILLSVLKGSVCFATDLSRHITVPVNFDYVAVSSYGSGTESSGHVQLLKDLTMDVTGRDVLMVEDIIDTGLTLSWLVANLQSRVPASVEILTLLRKPDALQMNVDVKYVGYDIQNEFVVGYGLDYDERYRNLRSIGTLARHVYT